MQKFKMSASKGSSKLTLIDALCNPQYRRATWINLGYIVFHELTGINVIMQYSNQMLKQMQSKTFPITPREGTYMVGVANFLTSFMSIFVVKCFKRRTLLIVGHLAIAAIHFTIG